MDLIISALLCSDSDFDTWLSSFNEDDIEINSEEELDLEDNNNDEEKVESNHNDEEMDEENIEIDLEDTHNKSLLPLDEKTKIKALLSILEKRESLYPTTLEQDQEILNKQPSYNLKNALIFRLSEKNILKHYYHTFKNK